MVERRTVAAMGSEKTMLVRLGTASWARLMAIGLVLLVVSWLVIERSTSAFSATTANGANHLATGSVVLGDDDGGTALWNATEMTALQSEQRCIEVTYNGSLTPASAIRIYGTYVDGPDAGTSADSALGPYLNMAVEAGAVGASCATFTGTTIASATGTFAAFASGHGDYTNGIATGWTPVGGSGESRAFRITLTVADDNLAQGKVAEPAFTWEARSS